MSRTTLGHHLNKFGSTRVQDATHLALFSLRTESDNPDATCEFSP